MNADVFGPPGLNGSDTAINIERAKGTVAIEYRSTLSGVVAAAVIAVPPDVKLRNIVNGLTDFVIVLVYRATGQGIERVLSDGRREIRPPRRPAGELSWQLDTGELRDDPIIGPIWYQARGWSCLPDDSSDIARLCALVSAEPTTAPMARDGT